MAEVEIKLALAPGAHLAFARHAELKGARPRTARLHAIYFDTPDHALRKQGMGLRLRRDGRRWTQTLKAGGSGAGGLHARDEWEHPVPGPELDLGLFADTPLSGMDGLSTNLAEIFRVEMRRTTWMLEVSPGNRVEVALDRGEVRHARGSEPVSEVEIESVEGDPLAVFELAGRLLAGEADARAALLPSAVTKAQRGYRLAGGDAGEPTKARAVLLGPEMEAHAAARAIAREALDQMASNEAGTRAGRDPEFLHQYRVGLRRLRSALGVFRVAIGEDALALRGESRWLGSVTGPAREWDVFCATTLAPLLEAYGQARAADAIRARAQARRDAAHARLLDALDSVRYARLLLALARWLAAAPAAAGEGESLAAFASRVVAKRRKRLLADARGMSALTAPERHALRLDAKRLRYALEGLGSLFRKKRVARLQTALSDIQDALGHANDAAVASRLLAELRPATGFAQFARGWLAAQAHTSAAGLGRFAQRLESVGRLRLRED